jgi:hypothetical protein
LGLSGPSSESNTEQPATSMATPPMQVARTALRSGHVR